MGHATWDTSHLRDRRGAVRIGGVEEPASGRLPERRLLRRKQPASAATGPIRRTRSASASTNARTSSRRSACRRSTTFRCRKDYPDYPSHRQLLDVFHRLRQSLRSRTSHPSRLPGRAAARARTTAAGRCASPSNGADARGSCSTGCSCAPATIASRSCPTIPERSQARSPTPPPTSGPIRFAASACLSSAPATRRPTSPSISPASPPPPRSACAKGPISFRS